MYNIAQLVGLHQAFGQHSEYLEVFFTDGHAG